MVAGEKRYKVIAMGRAGVTYSEGHKSVYIDGEMLMGGEHDILLRLSAVSAWDPPNEAELITDGDKKLIMERISKQLGRINWQ